MPDFGLKKQFSLKTTKVTKKFKQKKNAKKWTFEIITAIEVPIFSSFDILKFYYDILI